MFLQVLCNIVSILAVTGLMTLFSSQLELKQYLVEINPRYSNYAEALWANGVNSSSQLGNAPAPILADFGVQNALHAADIIAASKPTGKCCSNCKRSCLIVLLDGW